MTVVMGIWRHDQRAIPRQHADMATDANRMLAEGC
jgi:hypothetical protein